MKFTVIEHQKIYIGKNSDPEKLQISKKDAEDLIKIEEKNNKRIFKWGPNYISPQQWVGIISTANITIEILPKIADCKDSIIIKDIFINMLRVAYDIPMRKNIAASVKYGHHGFLDILAAMFLSELHSQVQSGLIRTYTKQSKNIPAVKGSINFTEHLNRNGIVQTRFCCTYSTLNNDNIINKAIKFTLIILSYLVKESRNKRMINSLLPYFENVNLVKLTSPELDNIIFDRNTCRYADIIDYCKIFLEGQSIQLESGSIKLDLMLFDMNNLFEKFLFKSLRQAIERPVIYQCSTNHLLESVTTGKRKSLLKPDILIKNNNNNDDIVIDTKWKNVKSFADEGDLYQMNAYLTNIPDLYKGILLYPKSDVNDKICGDYKLLNRDRNICLKVRTVDLSLISYKTQFLNHLANLLD